MLSLIFHYNLLCLLHIQVQIVILAPLGQASHQTTVDHVIVVDKTHHSRVSCKPNEEVEAKCRCAVVGQQNE